MSMSTMRVVLFLTPGIAGRVAEHQFNSVARRMGLPWTAIPRPPAFFSTGRRYLSPFTLNTTACGPWPFVPMRPRLWSTGM